MSDMNDILSILSHGYKIEFDVVPKRIDGENGRDWYIRFTWKVTDNGYVHECDWEGFGTPEECVSDMITRVNEKLL